MNLFLKKNPIISDKPGNLEGLGSFDAEPQIVKPKPTFQNKLVDFLRSPFPGSVQQNIRSPPNIPQTAEQGEQITSDHFFGLMGDQQSGLSSLSGYQSRQNTSPQNKNFVQRTQALNQFLGKPIAPDDCEQMKHFLEKMGNLKAFANPFKGPDSFFYCISKFVPNCNPANESSLLLMPARSGLAKFVMENKDNAYVSVIIFKKVSLFYKMLGIWDFGCTIY